LTTAGSLAAGAEDHYHDKWENSHYFGKILEKKILSAELEFRALPLFLSRVKSMMETAENLKSHPYCTWWAERESCIRKQGKPRNRF
jgi:hypothetical protein